MPPPSDKKEQREGRKAALEAEADRAGSLSLPQLAAELMTKAFTEVRHLGFEALVTRFAPGTSRQDGQVYERLWELVGDGLQVLEHASLVRGPEPLNGSGYGYTATRLGRAALEQGAVDRIIAGGSL